MMAAPMASRGGPVQSVPAEATWGFEGTRQAQLANPSLTGLRQFSEICVPPLGRVLSLSSTTPDGALTS